MSEQTTKLLFDVVLTLFAFFVTGPMVLNAISQFTVQKKLMKRMIENGILPEDKVAGAKDLYKSKKVAGVATSIVLLALVVVIAIKNAPWGYVCAAAGLALGIVKFRKACQYNSLATKNFKKSYRNFIDVKRFEKFEESEFGAKSI